MLKLTKFIGKGATRICFEHPEDPEKCVKVAVRFKDCRLLERELEAYRLVKNELSEFIIDYDSTLVETNFGYGLVCRMLRDDDGHYSKSLDRYMEVYPLESDICRQLYNFAYNLIEHDIFFYDFNVQNFLVQVRGGKKCLYYTDLKSFNTYKPWTFLRLEKIISPLARYLMWRRLRYLLKTVKQAEKV